MTDPGPDNNRSPQLGRRGSRIRTSRSFRAGRAVGVSGRELDWWAALSRSCSGVVRTTQRQIDSFVVRELARRQENGEQTICEEMPCLSDPDEDDPPL